MSSSGIYSRLIVLLFSLLSYSVTGQEIKSYIINPNGLSLFSDKHAKKTLVANIPYGDSVLVISDNDIDYAVDKITIDSIESFVYRVKYKDKLGYIASAYAIPFRAPKKGTKDIGMYMKSITSLEMPEKEYSFSDVSNDDYTITKGIYKNGMEAHYYRAYESMANTYFLPTLSLEQGFALLRLFSEFELLNMHVKTLYKNNIEYNNTIPTEGTYNIAIATKSTAYGIYEQLISINTGGFFDYKLYYQEGMLVVVFANYI